MARRGHCCRCSCEVDLVFAGGLPPGFSPNAPLPESAVAIAADLLRAMPFVIDGTTPQTSELSVCADGIGCGVLSRFIAPPVPTETYNAGYAWRKADLGPGEDPRFVDVKDNFTGTMPTTDVWTWPSNSWNIAINGQSRRTSRAELSLAVYRSDNNAPLATAASYFKRAPAFLVPWPDPIGLIRSQPVLHEQAWFAKQYLNGFQSLYNEPARFYFPLEPVTRKAAIQKVDIYWRPADIVAIPPGGQFPSQGKWGVVYLTLSDNKIYRWDGDSGQYEEIDATLDANGNLLQSIENPDFASSLNGTFISSAIADATNEEGSYFVWVTMSPNTSRQFFYPVSFVIDRTPPLATLAQARDWFADEAGFTNTVALSLKFEATEPCGISGAIGVVPASLPAGEHSRQLQGGPYRDRAGNNLPHTPSAAFTVHEKPDDDRYGAIASFVLPSETTSLYESGVTQLLLRFDRPVCGLTADNILIEKVVGSDWDRTAIAPANYEIAIGTSRKEWIVTIFEEQPPNSLWYATFLPIRDGDDAPNVFVVPPGIEHLTTPPAATNYGAVYWNANEKKDYVFTGPGNLEEATPERLKASPGLEVVDALPSQGNCRTVYEVRETGTQFLFLGGSYVTSDLRDTSRPVTYYRTVANVASLPLIGHPDTIYYTDQGARWWSDRGGAAANYAEDTPELRELYGISEPCRLAARTTWIVLPEKGKNAEPADVRVSRIGPIGDVASVSVDVDEVAYGEFIDADGDSENADVRDVRLSSTNGLRPRVDSPYAPEYSPRSSAGFVPRFPPSATDPASAVGRFSYWGFGTTIYPSPPALVDECAPPSEPQRHSSAIFSANTIASLSFSFRTTVEWANLAAVQQGINALTTAIPEYTPCPCTLCGATGKLPAVPCTLCEATGEISVCVEVDDKTGECVRLEKVACPQCGGDGNQVDAQDCPQCGGDGVDQCLGYKTVSGGGGFSLSAYIAYLSDPPLRNWTGVWPDCGPNPYPDAKASYMAEVFPGRAPPPYKIGEVTLEPFTVNASPNEPQNKWTSTNHAATASRSFTEYLPLQTTVVGGLILSADGKEPHDTSSTVCAGDPPDMGGGFSVIPRVSLSGGRYIEDTFPFADRTGAEYLLLRNFGPCALPTYLKRNNEGGYDPFTPTFAEWPTGCQDRRGQNEVVYRRFPRPGRADYGFFEEHWIWLDSGTRGEEPVGRQDITRSRGFHTWAVEGQLTRTQEETLASGGSVEWLEYQELRSPPTMAGRIPGFAFGRFDTGFPAPPYNAENMPFYNAMGYAAANIRFAINYYVSVSAS